MAKRKPGSQPGPKNSKRERTPEWSLLLYLLSEGCRTIDDLRRHYPRKKEVLDHQLEQLRAEGVVWFADDKWILDDKIGCLLVEPPARKIMQNGLQTASEAKLRLAQHIAGQDLLKYNDVIYLDTGSTLTNVALQLAFTARLRDVDVVTSNPFLIGMLQQHVRSLHFVGGHVRNDGRVVPLDFLEPKLPRKQLCRSFIGVYGITEEGLFCEEDLVPIKREAMELSQHEIFIPIDDRKVGAMPGGEGVVLMTFEEMKKLKLKRPSMTITIFVARPAGKASEPWEVELKKLKQRAKDGACKVVEVPAR